VGVQKDQEDAGPNQEGLQALLLKGELMIGTVLQWAGLALALSIVGIAFYRMITFKDYEHRI
jgi:hypothetical protein